MISFKHFINAIKDMIKKQGIKDDNGNLVKYNELGIMVTTNDGMIYNPCIVIDETKQILTVVQVVNGLEVATFINKDLISDVKIIYGNVDYCLENNDNNVMFR